MEINNKASIVSLLNIITIENHVKFEEFLISEIVTQYDMLSFRWTVYNIITIKYDRIN